MKSSRNAVAVAALVVGTLLAGSTQASAAETESAKALTWVGKAVPSDAPPTGKVARYEADPEVGTIRFLGFVTPEPQVTTSIIINNPPKTGDCKLLSTQAPYADYGFRGKGTKNGNWSNRKRIIGGVERCAGTYHAQSGGTSFNTPTLASGAFIDFTSPAVFTQIRI